MSNPAVQPGDLVVQGNLTVNGSLPQIDRSDLTQDSLQTYIVPWEAWRTWDAYAVNLPATGGTDDLGLYGTTWGTSAPSIQTGDVKTTTITRRARAMFCIPPEFVTG